VSVPRTFDQLVEHQVRRWEVERRSSTSVVPAPCVALSRQAGAGGASIGRLVAKTLDYGFFGIEIVDHIAREARIRRELVAGLDEHVRSAIDRFVIDSFNSRTFTETDYLRKLVEIVTTLGERGRTVVLGRGSTVILPPERALRVLAVAPVELRRERWMKDQGVSADEAVSRLARMDEDRLHFLRHHFGVDPDDPLLYDLVVNTGTIQLEDAADLVIKCLARRFPGSSGSKGVGARKPGGRPAPNST